ncbi:NfeD family protein [Humidisolicoccus flavus]|uniref:NfeD family protein n=1 Tax=Humidisolicoccus flavus TaxID=3111414 RepID=UPI00324E013C
MDLLQYAWVGWLVIALILFIIEMVTLEFTFLMLGTGSLIGLGSSLTGLPLWAQILIASLSALALLFLVRPSLLRRLQRNSDPAKSNVDALIGLVGEVTLPFQRGSGQVTLTNGDIWTARFAPSVRVRDLDVGERILVTSIEGATAIIVPAER